MIFDWLVSVPKADDPVYDPENRPTHWTRIGEYDDRWVYFDHTDTSPLLRPELSTSKLIGQWDFDGVLLSNLDSDYSIIRPLGNQTITIYDDTGNPVGTEEGIATKQLEYSHGLGWKQRQLQQTPAVDSLAQYPADEQPILLTFERRWDDTPGFTGWGWQATIEFPDPARDSGVRAIGIYDENWNYLYTTGAFVWTDTGIPDDEGNNIFKWRTVNPAGRVTQTEAPVHYALLYASIQEGRMTLEANQRRRIDHFWEFNQGGGQGAGVRLVTDQEVPVTDLGEGVTDT